MASRVRLKTRGAEPPPPPPPPAANAAGPNFISSASASRWSTLLTRASSPARLLADPPESFFDRSLPPESSDRRLFPESVFDV